jgi:hypothetical protein
VFYYYTFLFFLDISSKIFFFLCVCVCVCVEPDPVGPPSGCRGGPHRRMSHSLHRALVMVPMTTERDPLRSFIDLAPAQRRRRANEHNPAKHSIYIKAGRWIHVVRCKYIYIYSSFFHIFLTTWLFFFLPFFFIFIFFLLCPPLYFVQSREIGTKHQTPTWRQFVAARESTSAGAHANVTLAFLVLFFLDDHIFWRSGHPRLWTGEFVLAAWVSSILQTKSGR